MGICAPQVKAALASADAAWLHMERPDNLMTITGLLQFAEPLTLAEVRACWGWRPTRAWSPIPSAW